MESVYLLLKKTILSWKVVGIEVAHSSLRGNEVPKEIQSGVGSNLIENGIIWDVYFKSM